MEINFENRQINTFKEVLYQTKLIQETVETVVPDTDDDIGMLVNVQSAVLLKSKDITSRGVLISGEVNASLIYINESQEKLSCIKIRKGFSAEYEIQEFDPETLAQIKLHIISSEARIINPRKVSLTFEIAGELICYANEELSIEYGLPSDVCSGLHAKYENVELNVIKTVCEKTFSINEQFGFSGGKPKPVKLLSANVELNINETQFVGTKVIVKGNADISIAYLSDEVNYPLKAEFSTLFSQIIDLGENEIDCCSIIPALTGLYYSLAESISGDKVADIEIHALLQLCCRSNKEMLYISDVYSNLMKTDFVLENKTINSKINEKKLKVSGDERINVADECTDVLSIFTSDTKLVQTENCIKIGLNIDVIYKNKNGQFSAVRKMIMMQTEFPEESFRISKMRLSNIYFRPDGQYLDCHVSAELSLEICSILEIEKIEAVELKEDETMDFDNYPTLTLVRCSGESLWELAKTYHSSVEKITASNALTTELDGRMILVPKCI